MMQVRQTAVFAGWFADLRDRRAAARITARIDRLKLGNPGDVKAVGDGVSELRIDYGPGYRAYYKQFGKQIILLLCGGDKTTQSQDIRRAKALAQRYEGPNDGD